MGSKPVRERHLLLYGRAGTGLPLRSAMSAAQWREHQDAAMARLSETRHGLAASVQHHFHHRQKVQDLQQMELLFGPLTWLYASTIISKDEVEREMGSAFHRPGSAPAGLPASTSSGCFKRVARCVERLMRQHGVAPSEERPRRQQLQEAGRFGLLFDIITTRRVIMTGMPHMVATELYRYMADRYPVVKFTFIGITDNGSKRVARDIFSKDKLQGVADGYEKYIQKAPMDAVDDNHLYVVFPEDDARIADIIQLGLVRLHQEEEIRRNRFATPKYEPPPLPDFVQRALQAERMRQVRVPAVRCAACQQPPGPPAGPEAARSPPSRLEPLERPPGVLPTLKEFQASGPMSAPGTSVHAARGRLHATSPLQRHERCGAPKPLSRPPARSKRSAGTPTKAPVEDAPSPGPLDPEMEAHLRRLEERLAEINQQFKRRLKANKVEEPAMPLPTVDAEEQRQHQVLAALITHIQPELIEKRAALYKPLLNLP